MDNESGFIARCVWISMYTVEFFKGHIEKEERKIRNQNKSTQNYKAFEKSHAAFLLLNK